MFLCHVSGEFLLKFTPRNTLAIQSGYNAALSVYVEVFDSNLEELHSVISIATVGITRTVFSSTGTTNPHYLRSFV